MEYVQESEYFPNALYPHQIFVLLCILNRLLATLLTIFWWLVQTALYKPVSESRWLLLWATLMFPGLLLNKIKIGYTSKCLKGMAFMRSRRMNAREELYRQQEKICVERRNQVLF